MNLYATLKGFFKGTTATQTLYLYSSHIILMLLGVVTVTINTRALGPEGYGLLSFFITVTEFVGLFFSFGIFSSGGVIIAREEKKQTQNEIVGALIVLGLGMGVVFCIFIFVFSYFVNRIFKVDIAVIFRAYSPLLIFYPFPLLFAQVTRGTNRIAALSLFNIAPKILYLITIAALLLSRVGLSAVQIPILVHLLSVGIVVVLAMVHLRPSTKNIKRRIIQILYTNREYGFHVFLGRIVDKSTYKLDGIFISFFVNTLQLGFYNLAATLASPIMLLSQSLSTSMFRAFAQERKEIPRQIVLVNLLWLFVSTAGIILLGRYVVLLLFGSGYAGVGRLIWPLALTCLFQGMYQPYNSFLAAKGKGKWLRNVSFIQSGFNVVGNFLFIYYMGALGAALASMIAAALAYAGHAYYYYKAYRREIAITEIECDDATGKKIHQPE